MIRSAGSLLCLLLLCGVPSFAQTLAPSTLADPPPAEIAEPIRALLDAAGTRVASGSTTIDFWWVKSLARTGEGAPAWSQVAEGTLVGATRVSAVYRDIRGRTIKPGVYTLRYGIQPANGDHLGVSPYREFLLLSPAAVDTSTDATGHEGTVDLSKQTIGGSHPAVWSLDPPVATEPPLTVRTNDAGHEAVVFEIGAGGAPLRFGLILVGKIEA